MNDEPLYLYGLVGADVRLDERVLGEGLGGAPVRLLQDGPLGALVSALPDGPVAQTRRHMIAHTAVLERAMADATVLPVRFGTVAPGAASLAGCLLRNTAALRRALHGIAGRIELGVKASWRDGVIYAELVAGDETLRRLRDRLQSHPGPETYYERVELGRRVEAALAERRAGETAALVAGLSALAEREVELRAVEEDMILNRAFLVRRENEARFDAQMQHLAERCGDRVSLRYVGPVPPYNFVRLQADWLAAA